MHDRRQRRRELGRRALPEERVHREPRHRPDGRAARRRAGRARRQGARRRDGPDLLGVFIGSEGTLGIATEITLRIVRQPEAVTTQLAAFRLVDAAGEAVSAIVAAGILPAAIEMMDRLTIEAAEAAYRPGYPEGADAVLLVELDGVAVQVEEDTARGRPSSAARAAPSRSGSARDDAERALLWLGRKGAFPAMGRMSPDYYVQDGVVPRTKLPAVLRRIDELSRGARPPGRQRLPRRRRQPAPARPLRRRVEGESERAKGLAEAILAACVDAGGSLTGEHGDRRRQGVLDADDVLRARPRGVRAGPRARSTRTGSRTRARCSRRPGSAARCRARTVRIRSSGSGLPSVSSARTSRRQRPRSRGRSAEGTPLRIGTDLDDGRPRPRARARGGRPDVHRRGGHPALGPRRRCSAPPGSASRSTRRATRRSAPASPATSRGRSAPLRRAARPRARRHARARRRHDRERGRQGREERRRLRPRQARLRLARDGWGSSPASPCASIRSRGSRHRRRRDRRRGGRRRRAPLAPSSSRARSTSSTPAGSPCSSRARSAPSRRRSTRPRQRVGGDGGRRRRLGGVARASGTRRSAASGSRRGTSRTCSRRSTRPSCGRPPASRTCRAGSAACRRGPRAGSSRALAARLDPAGVLA